MMSPRTLKIGSLNVCGCSTLKGKKEVIGRTFVEEKFDMLVFSETKLKGKSECEFRCMSGRM